MSFFDTIAQIEMFKESHVRSLQSCEMALCNEVIKELTSAAGQHVGQAKQQAVLSTCEGGVHALPDRLL